MMVSGFLPVVCASTTFYDRFRTWGVDGLRCHGFINKARN